MITSAKDAGTAVFDNVMPRDLWRIRLYWGKMVSKMGPGYEPKLTAFNMPVWDQKKLSRIGHATPAPKIEPVYPDCDSFRPDIK